MQDKEDFDLDSLLSESTTLAAARKRKSSGHLLSADQTASLALARAMEEMNTWEMKSLIVHFQSTTCLCGYEWKSFCGKYLHYRHRKNGSDRLTLVQSPTDPLTEFTFQSHRTVTQCAECANMLAREPITSAELPLLTSLVHDSLPVKESLQTPPQKTTTDREILDQIEIAPPVVAVPKAKSVAETYSIKEILMRRDGFSAEDADEMIAEAKERVAQGEDPEEILHNEFGLEPDFVFELIKL